MSAEATGRDGPRPHSREISLRGVALVWLAVLFLAGVGVLLVWTHPWDPRLSAGDTAARLQARLHASFTYRCRRHENDGSVMLGDVDYYCAPRSPDGDGVGYWVGTNRHRITELVPTG